MATKKRKSISGIDRQIQTAKKKLAEISKVEREKKQLAKKQRMLKSLQSKLKTKKK